VIQLVHLRTTICAPIIVSTYLDRTIMRFPSGLQPSQTNDENRKTHYSSSHSQHIFYIRYTFLRFLYMFSRCIYCNIICNYVRCSHMNKYDCKSHKNWVPNDNILYVAYTIQYSNILICVVFSEQGAAGCFKYLHIIRAK